jgi:Bcr/CflA subfamily drug resistance transporter
LPALIIGYAIGALLSTDLYLPSMPLLTQEFGTQTSAVQQTLTVYLAGLTIANPFYGPLSDRYGRRPVMLYGGVAFLSATLICALSCSVNMLILGRFAQGATICSLTVTSRATIRELYDDARVTKLTAYIAMAEGIAPVVGPVIGAEILILASWRWNFILVFTITSFALVGLFFILPESNLNPNKQALKLRPLLLIYGRLLITLEFIGPVLAAGLVFGGLMLYITVAPFLLIDQLSLTPREFSQTQAGVVVGYILGLVWTSRLVHYCSQKKLLHVGLAAITLGSLSMLSLALCNISGFWAVIMPFVFYTFGIGIATAPLLTYALSTNRAATGSVAALLGTLTMGCAFLGSQTATIIYNGSILPVAWAISFAVLAALVVYTLSVYFRKL